jgi:hypothetical protein
LRRERHRETGTALRAAVAGLPDRSRPARPPEEFTALWESAVEPGESVEHPYLIAKQVNAYGIRVAANSC